LKQRVNLIEGLFSNEGHFVKDIKNYDYLHKEYDVHYYINGSLNEVNKNELKDFTVHEYKDSKKLLGKIFFHLFVFKSVNKKDYNLIMSAKYIPLLISSLFSRFWSYYLLVHFFPVSSFYINKLVLSTLYYFTNGFFVLSDSVKNDVSSKIIGCRTGSIRVIHSRDIEAKTKNDKKEKFVFSFIGAMNEFKDVSLLLNLIKEVKYSNVQFRFYSKGIKPYLKSIGSENEVIIKDEYFTPDEYDKFMSESDFVFVSYTQCYGVRFSGIVFDALNAGAQVVCNSNRSFDGFVNYNAISEFSNEHELDRILKNLKINGIDKSLLDQFSSINRKRIFTQTLESHKNRG